MSKWVKLRALFLPQDTLDKQDILEELGITADDEDTELESDYIILNLDNIIAFNPDYNKNESWVRLVGGTMIRLDYSIEAIEEMLEDHGIIRL